MLRDVESDTVKGTFWTDGIILKMLNETQLVFINHASRENPVLLDSLYQSTAYLPYTPGQDILLPGTYFHYASAEVGPDEDNLEFARTYLGGSGVAVLTTKINTCFIYRNIIYFVNNGVRSGGILHYYKYPSVISIADFEPSFYDDVYDALIVRHTTAVLGMKEVQSQRDYKNRQAQLRNMLIRPGVIQKYVDDKDRVNGEKI
mgnify:CR=1 FL=1